MKVEKVDYAQLERAAYLLKAVAHPTRLAIISVLAHTDDVSVTGLCEALDCEQSLLSHHLTNMHAKGVLSLRREGKNNFYYLTDKNVLNILDCINNCKM